MACNLTVRPGQNVWLLARTNRDAPSSEEVAESTAAFLIKVLGFASPVGSRGLFETMASPNGQRRYYIGAARPVEILTVQQSPITEGIPGAVYARREDCPEPELAFVAGKSSWYVLVAFDWRGDETVIPWPRRRVSWLGTVSTDDPSEPFDWLLLQASHVSAVPLHEDSSLAADVADAASEYWVSAKKEMKRLVKSSIPAVVVALGLGMGLALIWASKRAT